jgi:hypothetical protein
VCYETAVKKMEFVNGRMPFLILCDRWCSITIVNVHVITRSKDDVKYNL